MWLVMQELRLLVSAVTLKEHNTSLLNNYITLADKCLIFFLIGKDHIHFRFLVDGHLIAIT